MAVTFVLGRAGSGKTRRCFETIVEAMRRDPLGPPIYWLLPRQATFLAQRDLTCLSGLGAFCRARVVSFEDFGSDVFDDCGGSCIPQVTPLGRQMILGHLLRQNRQKLRFFSRVARQPGLAAELDATFNELERSGHSIEDLSAVISELSESNAADVELASLLDKFHDARLLYEAYTNYLGQERLDQHRRLAQVLASLSRCSFLSQASIYVDGFLDFSEHERRILVGAAKAGARLQIALLIDPQSPVVQNPHTLPDEMGLFRPAEETYRKLHFAFSQENVQIGDPFLEGEKGDGNLLSVQPGRENRDGSHFPFPPEGLRRLEQALFRDPIVPADDSEGIELVEAPDGAAEVDAAARGIGAMLMQGLRLREIAVLVRDLDRYHDLIDASFQEHGIPCFVDRRRTAADHPLVQFLRLLFQIARHDWPHEAVMSLLRTGLAGVGLYDADGLENYVLRHRIRGAAGWESPRPWNYRRNVLRPEEDRTPAGAEPQQAETIRQRLLQGLRPLVAMLRADDPRTVRQIATEIFAALDRFRVRETISGWMESATAARQLEQAAEHEQVWANVVDLFDQMVDLLGDERLTPGEFHDVLESGLDGFDLALTPPTVDQVLVGQVDRTRTPPAKAVFVLGLCDGEFPRAPREGSILTDREQRALRRRRIDLQGDLHQRLLDERLLGYIAFTRASNRLIVSRPLADDQGRPVEPSSFWLRLVELFPGAKRTTVLPARDWDPGHIATPRQLATSLMRWVRSAPDPIAACANPAWPALYHWFATHAAGDGALDLMRRRAWPALVYANAPELSPDVARELFTSPLKAGVSQLETFAACPFRHFARFGLGLRDEDRQEATTQDIGRLYHAILEDALKDVMRRRAEGDASARLEAAVERFVRDAGERVREEILLGSARSGYLLQRTHKVLQQVARAQREVLRRGLFRPAHVGVTFGEGGKLPPLSLQTPSGAQLLLDGKIDRIDRVESSGDVAVIDYRLGAGRLPVGMVLHGLSLRLLAHLLVLEAAGPQLAGRTLDPAAAFYLQLVRKLEDVKHPSEALDPSDPKWHLKLKPRGLFDRRCLAALDRDLSTGRSDVVQAYVKQDGSFGYRDNSDVAESEEFRAILRQVAGKLGELADGILSGRIEIAPYRLKETSPCPNCEYQSVCRFDPAINRYNHLSPIDREELMAGSGRDMDV